MAIFDEKIEIRERCKGVHCVDLGESFPTSISLQNLVSIQPRTSPVKFAASRDGTSRKNAGTHAPDVAGDRHGPQRRRVLQGVHRLAHPDLPGPHRRGQAAEIRGREGSLRYG